MTCRSVFLSWLWEGVWWSTSWWKSCRIGRHILIRHARNRGYKHAQLAVNVTDRGLEQKDREAVETPCRPRRWRSLRLHWRNTHEKSQIVDAAGFEGDGASMHVLNPRDPRRGPRYPHRDSGTPGLHQMMQKMHLPARTRPRRCRSPRCVLYH